MPTNNSAPRENPIDKELSKIPELQETGVSQELKDLREDAAPEQRFEQVLTKFGEAKDRVPFLKNIDAKQAASIISLFALLAFMHMLGKRKEDSAVDSDKARAEKDRAEVKKIEAETEAIRNNTKTPDELKQEIKKLKEEVNTLKQGKTPEPFVTVDNAGQFQNTIQTALKVALGSAEPSLDEGAKNKLSTGATLTVYSDGSLVMNLSKSLVEKAGSLEKVNPELGEMSATWKKGDKVTINREEFYRIKFLPTDTEAKVRFEKLLKVLNIDKSQAAA